MVQNPAGWTFLPKRSRRRSCALLLAAAAGLLWNGNAAARVEFSAGRSYTLRNDWTNAAFFDWIGEARPAWKLRWAPAFGLGHFNARPDLVGEHLHDTVWVGAAGARLYMWREAFFGFQVAATAGRTDALSSVYEFVSSLGWQDNHWQFMLRHISNGDFHEPNHGETMFLVGISF